MHIDEQRAHSREDIELDGWWSVILGSVVESPLEDRLGVTLFTDLSVVEFEKWYKTHWNTAWYMKNSWILFWYFGKSRDIWLRSGKKFEMNFENEDQKDFCFQWGINSHN